MGIRPELLDAGVDTLRELLHDTPPLAAELEGSLTTFFGGPAPLRGPLEALLDARRHLEWFLFERHSEHLVGLPAERLMGAWRQALRRAVDPARGESRVGTPEELPDLERGLLESVTGIFEVTALHEDGAWLQDVTGLGHHALLPRPDARPLEAGDLLVGRLFPDGEGAHVASPAAAVFRGGELRRALERDLERLRNNGGPSVVRLSQLELERMFFSGGELPDETAPASAPVDPVGDARRLLAEGGLDEAAVEDVLARLRARPIDPSRWAIGTNDALGPVLDQLAFHTDVDLTRAREVLGAAWLALSHEVERLREAPRDPRAALAAFDAGRAAGRDLDSLIHDLTVDLGLELDEDADESDDLDEAITPVGALLQEFRWELGATGTDAAEADAHLRSLASLARFGERLPAPEDLDAERLRTYATFWLLEQRVLRAPAEAVAFVAALRAFCAWAREAQELDLGSFEEDLDALAADLPRMVALNASLRTPPGERPGQLERVLATDSGGVTVESERGDRATLRTPGLDTGALRPGDLLRAERIEDELEVRCVYPAVASKLRASR